MTQDEKRIKIAEACWWKVSKMGWWSHPTLPDNGGSMHDPPDYFNDLNAMHEAEKVFIGDASGSMTYAMHLLRVRGQNISNEYEDINCDHAWITASATAAQRAEAFGKTLNLW